MEESNSLSCETCESNNVKYKVDYKRVDVTNNNNNFFNDEQKCEHVHNTTRSYYYECNCSNGHNWKEYPIFKCSSCSDNSEKYEEMFYQLFLLIAYFWHSN